MHGAYRIVRRMEGSLYPPSLIAGRHLITHACLNHPYEGVSLMQVNQLPLGGVPTPLMLSGRTGEWFNIVIINYEFDC